MRIPLTPAKADKLTALLAKANGCGRAHTYTHASDLMALASASPASTSPHGLSSPALDRAGL